MCGSDEKKIAIFITISDIDSRNQLRKSSNIFLGRLENLGPTPIA